MPYALYVCLQDDDKIAVLAIDAETGRLTPQAEVPATGGPSVMASSPDRRTLYIGHRTRPAISSFRINQSTGGLTLLGTVPQEHAPPFSLLTATASICYAPIIRAAVRQFILSEKMARRVRHPSAGWQRPLGPTP
jgi:6-phosphogluconolactonase (cycloisomerase 2 family)